MGRPTNTDLSECPSPADVKATLAALKFTAAHDWRRSVKLDMDVRDLLVRALDNYKLCPKCKEPQS
jgi:hypothetical protein